MTLQSAPFVVVARAVGIGFRRWLQKCRMHDYLLVTSGLTISVALLWPPCGRDFPSVTSGLAIWAELTKYLPKLIITI